MNADKNQATIENVKESSNYTTLLASLYRLDDEKESVFDVDTDCTISRDHNGDLLLTVDSGSKKYSTTYRDLLVGPCRGLKAKLLALTIRGVMKRRLRGESDFPAAEVLTNPSAKGDQFDLSEDVFEDDDTTDLASYVGEDDVDEVEDILSGTDDAGYAVTSE